MWKPLKFHQTTNQRSSFDSIASVRIIRLLSPFFLLYARRERIFHFHFNKSCWNIEQISLVVCSSHAMLSGAPPNRLSAYISYKCKVSNCSWLCWWERKYLFVECCRIYIFSHFTNPRLHFRSSKKIQLTAVSWNIWWRLMEGKSAAGAATGERACSSWFEATWVGFLYLDHLSVGLNDFHKLLRSLLMLCCFFLWWFYAFPARYREHKSCPKFFCITLVSSLLSHIFSLCTLCACVFIS